MAQITSANILKILSAKWQSLDEIVIELQINDLQDIKYLKLKLKEFVRKNLIKFIYYKSEKYWKSKKPENSPLKVPNNLVDVYEQEEYVKRTNYIDFYLQLLYKDSQNINAWKELAYYYKGIDSSKENLCLERIIDLDPFDEETWQYLAFKYIIEKDIDHAIKYLKSAYRIGSDELNPEFNLLNLKLLGFLYYWKADFQKALEYYESAFELGWDREDFYIKDLGFLISLGFSYEKNNQPDKAIIHFKKILKISSIPIELFVSALTALGIAYWMKENYDKAIKYIEKAIELDPKEDTLKKILKFVVNAKKMPLDETLEKPTYQNQIEINKNSILLLLRSLISKFDKLIEVSEFTATIHYKSFINDLIKPFFRNPSKKKIRKLKNSLEKYIEDLPDVKKVEFINEYFRTIKRYKDMQPSKWKKWGNYLLKILPLLR